MYDDYDEYQSEQKQKEQDRRDEKLDKKKRSRKKNKENHSKMYTFVKGELARDVITGSKVQVLNVNRKGQVPQYKVRDLGTTCKHPCIHNIPAFNMVPIKQ